MPKLKIFFETSVILGAAQIEVFNTSPQLNPYIDRQINRPNPHKESNDLIARINSTTIDVEPYTSSFVKKEIRTFITDTEKMKKKILGPLRVESAIKKLEETDKKIFELVLYDIFFIKLPAKATEVIDGFSSTMVTDVDCELIRDEVFDKVYRPLLIQKKQLSDIFDLGGDPKQFFGEQLSEKENFYNFLKKALSSFRHQTSNGNYSGYDYKQLYDLRILAEAIFTFRKMIKDYSERPVVYFVSSDKIFVPTSVDGTLHSEISKLIKKHFGTNIASSRHMLVKISDFEKNGISET